MHWSKNDDLKKLIKTALRSGVLIGLSTNAEQEIDEQIRQHEKDKKKLWKFWRKYVA